MKTPNLPLDHNTIAALAQKHWEEEGKPEGHALDHWLRAESELKNANNGATGRQAGTQRSSETPVRSPKQENL